MPADVEGFLARFREFGARPSTERYLRLFHPDATLFDSGMAAPISAPEIPEHIEGILKLVPDFRMTPERWREGEGTLFVEARNEASLGPHALRWRSVYCMDLEGDRVRRGRRYYDRRALYGRLDPSLPALPAPALDAEAVEPGAEPGGDALTLAVRLGEAFAAADAGAPAALFREDAAFVSPEHARPIARGELASHHRAFHALWPGAKRERLACAGDAGLAFVEWRVVAEPAGGAVSFDVVERVDCAGGAILSARAYFDTLALAQRLAEAS